jgi:hypothetical protein
MPAQMTAKIVIASAKRLMLVRHFCRNRKSTARDQRAGVADADPEHEVGDVPGPALDVVVAPDADAAWASLALAMAQ